MAEKDVEDQFKDRLGRYEEDPGEGAWDLIEKELPAARPSWYRFAWPSAILVLLLTTGTFTWVWIGSEAVSPGAGELTPTDIPVLQSTEEQSKDEMTAIQQLAEADLDALISEGLEAPAIKTVPGVQKTDNAVDRQEDTLTSYRYENQNSLSERNDGVRAVDEVEKTALLSITQSHNGLESSKEVDRLGSPDNNDERNELQPQSSGIIANGNEQKSLINSEPMVASSKSESPDNEDRESGQQLRTSDITGSGEEQESLHNGRPIAASANLKSINNEGRENEQQLSPSDITGNSGEKKNLYNDRTTTPLTTAVFNQDPRGSAVVKEKPSDNRMDLPEAAEITPDTLSRLRWDFTLRRPSLVTMTKVDIKEEIIKEEVVKEERSQKKKVDWDKRKTAIYAQFMPTFTYNRVETNRNDNQLITAVEKIPAISAERMGIRVEAGLTHSIRPRLSLFAGILYFQRTQNINYFLQTVDSVSARSDGNVLVITPGLEEEERTYEHEIQTAGIQLGALYKLPGRKVASSIGSGLELHRSLRKQSNDLFEEPSLYVFYNLFYRLEYPTDRRFRFLAQPTFNYSLRLSNDLNTPFYVQPYGFGLNFGFTFKL